MIRSLRTHTDNNLNSLFILLCSSGASGNDTTGEPTELHFESLGLWPSSCVSCAESENWLSTDYLLGGILLQQDVSSSSTLMLALQSQYLPPCEWVLKCVCVTSEIAGYPPPCYLSRCPSPLVSLLCHSPPRFLSVTFTRIMNPSSFWLCVAFFMTS